MDHLCYFCLILLCFHARLFDGIAVYIWKDKVAMLPDGVYPSTSNIEC